MSSAVRHVEAVCTGNIWSSRWTPATWPRCDAEAAPTSQYRSSSSPTSTSQDPYYGEDSGFDDILDQIEKAADLWVAHLTT